MSTSEHPFSVSDLNPQGKRVSTVPGQKLSGTADESGRTDAIDRARVERLRKQEGPRPRLWNDDVDPFELLQGE